MKHKARSTYGLVLHLLVVAFFAITLSACPSGTSEEGGGGATASIVLSADPESIPADGDSSTTITATLLSSAGTAVASGTRVTFSTTLGTFPNGESSYEVTYTAPAAEEGAAAASESKVTVSLVSGLVPGVAAVTAESNGVRQTVYITFTGEGATVTPKFISLATTKTSVKSDNSDSATVTATVLEGSYAVVPGVTVIFNADGGSISASSAKTDDSGRAEIMFRSGTVDKSNKTVTITAKVSGLEAQIPLKIVGSTLSLTTSSPSIPNDGSTRAILTIIAKDAGGVEVFNAPLTMTVSGAGGAILTQYSADYPLDSSQAPVYSGNTDVLGKFKVYVTGTRGGAVTVTVTGLGDTKTMAYTVTQPTVTFEIERLESPAGNPVTFKDPFPLSTNTVLKIFVNAPDPGKTHVVFATTVGGWIEAAGEKVYEAPIGGGKASARLSSSAAGLASVQVNYKGGSTPSDSMTVAISAPSSEAAQLTIQASAYVVAPSTGGVTNSVTLKATVKNAGGQVVGGAPVAFSIDNATGGGEYVSPVVVYTDVSGIAETTFYSGSLSTDPSGVEVSATVVGTVITDSVNIVIGGTAGSVSIGRGTVVQSEYNDTVYELPMSVLVADSQGNPVTGAVVTLGTWPASYRTGGWYDSNPDPEARRFVPYISGSFDNEDVNRNLIKDAGEDVNMDGYLTPPNSAAGDLPETVTTDANGVANFSLFYLKANAIWIVDRISASTMVFGTETTSSIDLTLPAERLEAEEGLLSDSSWAAWVAGAPGDPQPIEYTMPWFTGWGYDYFTAVHGTFAVLGLGYTDSKYEIDISGEASGTIISDVVSITDDLGRGIVVPFRVVVK